MFFARDLTGVGWILSTVWKLKSRESTSPPHGYGTVEPRFKPRSPSSRTCTLCIPPSLPFQMFFQIHEIYKDEGSFFFFSLIRAIYSWCVTCGQLHDTCPSLPLPLEDNSSDCHVYERSISGQRMQMDPELTKPLP